MDILAGIGVSFVYGALAFMTFGILFSLWFGGEEFSPAPIRAWMIAIPIISYAWYLLVSSVPITIGYSV